MRLIIFVAGIAAVILLRQDAQVAGLSAIVAVAAFAGVIWRHRTWENRRIFVEHLHTVVEESLHASTRRDRPARTWQRPEDPADSSAGLPVILEPGPTWPLTRQEQDDLDLYGLPVGLFGLLNRTSTPLGARRLRDMLDTPILGLIDEPFRGTNSQERTAAGLALVEHLTASPNLFLIATHEELLARVAAQTVSARNYHFQEDLHHGGVTFDYRLGPGPATTRTALRILEQEGYPKALLERARGLMPPEHKGE